MSFKHIQINEKSENFNRLISHPAVNFFLTECDGYIAGGLAEKEYTHQNISYYLKPGCNNYSGDVDLYFKNAAGHKKAVDYAYKKAHTVASVTDDTRFDCSSHFEMSDYCDFIANINYQNKGTYNKETYDRHKHIRHVEKATTDISHQVYIDIMFDNASTSSDEPVKVQLIGKDFIGNIEDILNTFDFENVQLAYYLKNGLLFSCQNKNKNEQNRFRNRNKLKILNSHSPLLMHRINKYLSYRGFDGVTAESKQHIIEWLIKARSGHFKNPISGITLWQDALNNTVIRRAIADRIIPDDALPLIIGKVITEKKVYKGYRRYDYVKIDEAMEAIKQRKLSQNNSLAARNTRSNTHSRNVC
jgi:hypothetical protein